MVSGDCNGVSENSGGRRRAETAAQKRHVTLVFAGAAWGNGHRFKCYLIGTWLSNKTLLERNARYNLMKVWLFNASITSAYARHKILFFIMYRMNLYKYL